MKKQYIEKYSLEIIVPVGFNTSSSNVYQISELNLKLSVRVHAPDTKWLKELDIVTLNPVRSLFLKILNTSIALVPKCEYWKLKWSVYI